MKIFRDRLAGLFGRRSPPLGARDAAPVQAGEQSDPASPAFVPGNALETALVRAATNPAGRAAFQKLLLDATLYAATPDAPETAQSRTLETDEQISIVHATGPDGQSLPAIFTSEQRVAEAFGAGGGFIAIEGEAMLGIVKEAGAFLNPGLDYGVIWTPADLAAILGEPVQRVVEQETQVMLGSPQKRPDALIADLSAAMDGDQRIDEAWLALAHWPERDEYSWYLDIRSTASQDEIVGALSRALNAGSLGEHSLDMVVSVPDGTSGTGIRIKPSQTH